MPILKIVDLEDSNLCFIDYQIPKLAGLEGLPNLLLQQAKGLADFEEILVLICETLNMRRSCSCCHGN